ncbi:two-component system KDP operon response regulator KdpE [Catenuloplanes nepalensis]|uniref:Two-component system KDP operon response regulator KdpE n=1 Tax=Catenuloplanes nepalensis TaxID=587533 RepID=A0ABT9N092_9ACTN|nr:response regulator [Catenuloplanes nepalensis]MDP9797074.1 two-component system KDP operon response regulator KdpE [Catenuloplanes nepalensis]
MTARILLVEDEELNRVLVRAVLARADDPDVRDARLVEAGTLAAARDELRHPDQIDVVLLDMNLPDGSGLDLATEIADIEEKPKVIALTASVLPSDRAAALEAGCDGFLDKPYAAADLVTVIATHLPH